MTITGILQILLKKHIFIGLALFAVGRLIGISIMMKIGAVWLGVSAIIYFFGFLGKVARDSNPGDPGDEP